MKDRADAPQENSYGQILKASSLVGGAEAVSVVLGFARMKFAAVLIGPVGLGLAGAYMAVKSVVGTLAGLGVQTSAVRDVSSAVAKEDATRIGETVRTLRRVVWVTGLLGALGMAVLSNWLSQWTFGSKEHAAQIALLGLVILFANIQAGQMALIQGMRRIADLARLRIFTGLVTTIFTIACYWLFGLQGIIPALVGSGFLSLCVATLYARRVPVPEVPLSWGRTIELAGGMVRLGIAFMWAALLTAFVAYFARALITQQLGLAEVGFYTAAFTLSGVFVNFVLNAMGADYFPRLTAVADDHAQMKAIINEQTEIGILLAVPGLLFMLALAPWLISIFYTAEFMPAADLLRWFLLGCLGRVVSWPLGFVLIAQGRAHLYAFTESAVNLLHIGSIWMGLMWFGLQGTAMAFALLYVVYILVIRLIVGRLIGFNWTSGVFRLAVLCAPAAVAVFVLGYLPHKNLGIGLAALVASATAMLCARALFRRLGPAHRLARIAARIPAGRFLFGVHLA